MTPVTGLPQVDGWAQVISHPSASLFCVLAVQGQNANSVGKNLTELLLSTEITSSAVLHNTLLDLLQNAREELCKVQLACSAIVKGNRVVAATNSGSVFLKRSDKVGEILSSSGDLKIIEGNFQEKDLFVLATESAKNTFSPLKDNLDGNTESIATKLVSLLQEKSNSSLVALGLIEEGQEEAKEETKKKSFKFNFDKTIILEKIKIVGNVFKKIDFKKIISIPKKFIKKPAFLSEKIGGEQNKNTQLFLKAAFIFVTVLIAIIFWKQQSIKKELEPITPILKDVEQRFEQLKENESASDLELRTEARNLLKELEDLISQNQDKKYSLDEIKKHYQKIQEFSESISGVESQGPLNPFFDLRLAEVDFVAKRNSISENHLFSLDAAGKKGVYVNLENKQATKFSIDEIEGEVKDVSLNDESVFLLGGGLHSFDIDDQDSYKQLKEEGDSDRGGIILETYGSYLYVLNPEKRNIYRYLLKDGELSEPIGWLIDKQDLDFSSVESMAIDGDLWLTDQNGKIFKYTQGKRQEFEIKNLPVNFEKPIKISTSENNDYLYVLDKENQKVVILQKDGEFVKEIISESLSSGDCIVALDNNVGALVISGSLVYEIFP